MTPGKYNRGQLVRTVRGNRPGKVIGPALIQKGPGRRYLVQVEGVGLITLSEDHIRPDQSKK
jgi:hypothetical protein